MKIKSHTFRGIKYLVEESHLCGYVEVPGRSPKELHIQADESPKETMHTFIHEAMHAEDRKVPERVIVRRSRSLVRWLWRNGYRRTKDA